MSETGGADRSAVSVPIDAVVKHSEEIPKASSSHCLIHCIMHLCFTVLNVCAQTRDPMNELIGDGPPSSPLLASAQTTTILPAIMSDASANDIAAASAVLSAAKNIARPFCASVSTASSVASAPSAAAAAAAGAAATSSSAPASSTDGATTGTPSAAPTATTDEIIYESKRFKCFGPAVAVSNSVRSVPRMHRDRTELRVGDKVNVKGAEGPQVLCAILLHTVDRPAPRIDVLLFDPQQPSIGVHPMALAKVSDRVGPSTPAEWAQITPLLTEWTQRQTMPTAPHSSPSASPPKQSHTRTSAHPPPLPLSPPPPPPLSQPSNRHTRVTASTPRSRRSRAPSRNDTSGERGSQRGIKRRSRPAAVKLRLQARSSSSQRDNPTIASSDEESGEGQSIKRARRDPPTSSASVAIPFASAAALLSPSTAAAAAAAAAASSSAVLHNIRAAALESVMRENDALHQAAQDDRIRRLEEELQRARSDAQRDRQFERSRAELAALRAAILNSDRP
jgi:hypothetical protein